MPSPPTFRKANPSDLPILYISLASPTLPLTLDWITTHLLQQKQIFPEVPQTLEEMACLTDSKLVSCTNRTL